MDRKKSRAHDIKNHLITRWTNDWARKEKDKEMKVHIDKLIENARVALEQNENYKQDYSPQEFFTERIDNSTYGIPQENGHLLLQHPAQTKSLSGIPSNISDNSSISIEIDANVLGDTQQKMEKPKQIEEVIGQAAARIAQDIGANCVTSIERKGLDLDDRDHINVQVSIFRRLQNGGINKVEYQTKMRKVMSGSVVPIKELLMEAINKKYINKGDRVVCVEDESLGMGYKGLMFIFDVDKIFFNISNLNLASNISAEVLEATINVALEISKEGREGKKIGTAFIIGAKEELAKYTKQMILNPFSGYPEELRKITELNMNETVKEFAQLDGVFIIDESGLILSAGTHINVDASTIELPGYGTRHRCSAAITKACNSIAVVVSESGGIISIFKNGKFVMKLP
ncbi:MAG TPA: diadenylate cyclase [Candidatus Nanoarchaeia archaeon]|nr:diadenylate cyclase [Candidatus Nanoarchaeia archaeon]